MMNYGSQIQNSFGGGGTVYLTNLVPSPDSTLPDGNPIVFTLGVSGDQIDLSSVRITANGDLVFNGSSFLPSYISSTYVASSPDNGYTFSIALTGGFIAPDVTVIITTKTVDGVSANQTFSVQTTHISPYPVISFGSPLVTIPLASCSGIPNTGFFTGVSGSVFFTPNLYAPYPMSQLDIDDILLESDPV